MRKTKLVLFSFLLLILISSLISAQEISDKKDIAVFQLSYYGYDIPSMALGGIDQEIQNVFVKLGRFNVIGMTYRLEQGNINGFIQKIQSFKEEDAEIPEEVSMGHATFSESDMRKLVSSFIVVIPVVTYYNVEQDKDDDGELGKFKVTLETAITVLNVETMLVIDTVTVKTTGKDKDKKEAIKEAIDSIANKLTLKVKKIEEFTIKTGVIDVRPGTISLLMGTNMGLQVGYEFVKISKTLIAGYERVSETGLVLLSSVSPEISDATILYGDFKEGDQLKEVPRSGFDVAAYYHALIDVLSTNMTISHILGIKGVMSMGMYSFKPVIGLEFPIINYGGLGTDILNIGVPMCLYIGGELNMYMGRIQAAPMIGIGATGIVPSDTTYTSESFLLSHVGGMGMLSLSYLATRDVKIFADAGYAYWLSMAESIVRTYQGVILGAGVTFKL